MVRYSARTLRRVSLLLARAASTGVLAASWRNEGPARPAGRQGFGSVRTAAPGAQAPPAASNLAHTKLMRLDRRPRRLRESPGSSSGTSTSCPDCSKAIGGGYMIFSV